ncbi:50S ribosomal protein L29 [Candidatus Sneabacter namystus]|uniref:Large ribosomal subunit protein uL29 n=1 Tax=Candidatus Sneabacter namystus TaxID=2601646 RepID=A0A5C0ULL9_9RICK|nr:50S ribosomal protein L29 [Candidatus Sneabacter namystus]QEK39774.1 50S ribosomal protein L29 [Candidatus Sneabacter namystus]
MTADKDDDFLHNAFKEINSLKKDLFQLRLKKSYGDNKDTSKPKKIRVKIAQIYTSISLRKRKI